MQRINMFIALFLVASASAQLNNWTPDQVNTSICVWNQPRAALIRDTIYFDGGEIWWSPGLADGRVETARNDGNLLGLILAYNLSKPFDADTNVTGILLEDRLSKARGGEGNSNGAAPNYYDGALLANDAEFILYGGALGSSEKNNQDPDPDQVLAYQAYKYGEGDKSLWQPSFDDVDLGDEVNRYVAYGAGVNAPSEQKAWYFSGMTSPSGGVLYYPPRNESDLAQNISNYLIEVDMSTQGSEEWTNRTLPSDIQGRANAEAVWVPVGEQGILVILGGVIYPEWATEFGGESEDEDASEEESPKFMQTIDIYDIANNKWYQQPTDNGPNTRTRGCAVMAAASDRSSFNIYYYGGFDGIHPTDAFSDDVWVLSLPSFTWTQLNKGTSLHGRAGHKCFTPYPDQMMVFGGYTPLIGSSISCLDQGPLVIFNLSSGEWMDSYHPDKHDDYGVPDKVREAIGGDAAGGATLTTPIPSGWEDDALGDVFASSYDMDKITTWGPYKADESEETGRPEFPGVDDDDDDGGSGLPSWVAPVLGVVLGLMVVTAAIVFFCLWRRRKIFKNRSSDYGTEDAGNRILSWIRGQPTEKAVTNTESDFGHINREREVEEVKPTPDPSSLVSTPPPPHIHHEAAGTPIAELGDTSPPAELSEESALSPSRRQSVLAAGQTQTQSHRSWGSLAGGANDCNSTVSRTSDAANSNGEARPDSPSLPNTPEPGQRPGQGHGIMRSFGETLDDSSDGRPGAESRASSQANEPISPFSAGDAPSDDFTAQRTNLVSPLRRSVFIEHDEEDSTGKKS